MKYIRTKDGIYDIENSEEHFFTGLRRKSPFAVDYEANPQDCKTTDTIEELCDEFVVENPEKDIHRLCCDKADVFLFVEDAEIPIGIKEYDEKRDLISGRHDWKVYGAIWTDKGLIYVAKINEKGVLELL